MKTQNFTHTDLSLNFTQQFIQIQTNRPQNKVINNKSKFLECHYQESISSNDTSIFTNFAQQQFNINSSIVKKKQFFEQQIQQKDDNTSKITCKKLKQVDQQTQNKRKSLKKQQIINKQQLIDKYQKDIQQSKNDVKIDSQQKIRLRMKKIDNMMKQLSAQRNRLKYFLRKDKKQKQHSQQQDDSLQTKQCPCCGKLISKLCFRCEHLYCNSQNCTRKKKQKLNARMLEKMKQKKQPPMLKFGRKKTRSQTKKKQRIEDISQHQSQQQKESTIQYQQFSDFSQQEPEKKKKHKHKQAVVAIDLWNKTLSQPGSINQSKLFISSEAQSLIDL